MPRTQNIYRTL